MADSMDRVVSYTVNYSGVQEGTDAALQDALSKGYRVVDVIVGVPSHGGASSQSGFVCVTVVLTKWDNPNLPYKVFTK